MKLFSRKKQIRSRRLSESSISSNSNQFHRNRTISYSLKTDESSRHKAHKLVIQRRKVFSIFLSVFLIIVAIWLLINSFTANISVGFSDANYASTVNQSEYIKIIDQYFNEHPFSRFSFVLDESELTSYVTGKMPEVKKISLTHTTMGSGDYTISMRQPVAGWNINSKQYYVDSDGIPFEKNYFAIPQVQIVDNSGVSIDSDDITAIVSKRFLSFVGQVVSLAQTNGYTVTQAVLPVNTTRELDINLKESSVMVKLSIDRAVGEQIEDMSNALKYFIGHGQAPQYIDVRVSGRAFYK